MSTNRSCVDPSRRGFLTAAAAASISVAACGSGDVAGQQSSVQQPRDLVGDGRKRRILLRGGVVLTLDATIGDFERADVLIDGKFVGQTPLLDILVPTGTHQVKMVSDADTLVRNIDVGRRNPVRYVWKGGETWELHY